MPGPYRAAAGKPHAVRKRPRRGQDPSLRTAPSTSARTPPQVRAATRQRAATHVGGGVPDAPETFCRRPFPAKPPGRACPAPTARRWASPMPSANARGGVKTPPYGPTHRRVPAPYSDYVNYIRRAGCPHSAASSRGYPSTGGHPRRGRRPRRPGNLPSPPIPGKTSGPGMPGPDRTAAGKHPAVRKRPRRGQDPSLRTAPSTSAHTPPQVRAAARQRAATHVGGGVPDAPETFCRRPSPGKPPGRACPAPTARRWASPMPSINAHGGVKTPPYGPPHQRVPRPPAAVRERRQKNRGDPFSRDCLGSLYKHISA